MIECAINKKAEIVLLTRDSDFGSTVEKNHFLNGFLRQEFSERVSRKRNVYLCRYIFEALKHLGIRVTEQEALEEREVVASRPKSALGIGSNAEPEKLGDLVARMVEGGYGSVFTGSLFNSRSLLDPTFDTAGTPLVLRQEDAVAAALAAATAEVVRLRGRPAAEHSAAAPAPVRNPDTVERG